MKTVDPTFVRVGEAFKLFTEVNRSEMRAAVRHAARTHEEAVAQRSLRRFLRAHPEWRRRPTLTVEELLDLNPGDKTYTLIDKE